MQYPAPFERYVGMHIFQQRARKNFYFYFFLAYYICKQEQERKQNEMSLRLISFRSRSSVFLLCRMIRFVFRCWQQLPYSLKSAAAGCSLAACMFNV